MCREQILRRALTTISFLIRSSGRGQRADTPVSEIVYADGRSPGAVLKLLESASDLIFVPKTFAAQGTRITGFEPSQQAVLVEAMREGARHLQARSGRKLLKAD